MPDEHDVTRPDRFSPELDPGLGRRPVTLPIIAGDTRGDEIFPGIRPSLRLGNDMIHGEGHLALAAVLTLMSVPADNVLPGEDDLFVGNTNVKGEAHNAWERHRAGYRSKISSVDGSHQLCLPQPEQNDRLADVTYTQWLVVMVQYENLA